MQNRIPNRVAPTTTYGASISKLKDNLTYKLQSIQDKCSEVLKHGYVIMFACFTMYFVFNLVMVDEYTRLDDQTTGWAAFISALLTFISYLTSK